MKLLLSLFFFVLFCQAASAAGLDTRVAKLERILNTGTLIELLDKVEQMQKTVRELRGEIEQQQYVIKQLKQQQRDRYLDIDKRLQQIEAGQTQTNNNLPVQPLPVLSKKASGAIEVTEKKAVVARVPVSSNPAKEESEYQQAFNLLKEGRYDQAGKAFKKFLKSNPESELSSNAQYWLGETYYVTRQFKLALKEFNEVVTKHANSPKLTHAMLKIGYIQHELGDKEGAKATLEGLQKQYPKSTAARLARERLARIKRESGSE